MKNTIRTAAFMAITALAIGAPQQASATLTDGPEEIEQARDIQLQAQQLAENLQEYKAASQLYRRAAELYGEHEDAAQAWAWAGRLSYYAGDNRAVSDLRKAGEIAIQYGDVGFAARAFMDAAWLAHKQGMNTSAIELATRATDLAKSPYLAEADREALQRRVKAGTDQITG